MSRRLVTTIGLLAAALLVAPASAAPTAPTALSAPAVTGATTRVSVATGGTQANGDSFDGSTISADGRYVAFTSAASNLVAGDTNDREDVFVRDRVTGDTTRVSVATGGTQANNGSLDGSTISADGRYVAFTSDASNLVAGDTNFALDAFMRDRVTGTTTRVSLATDGTQADGNSFGSTISADGRYVAFTSDASNLVADDTNAPLSDAFVRDRVTGATTRVSVATDGTQANSFSNGEAISADGRYVAFTSEASNLVAGDTNGRVDVFLRDRVTGATTRVSVATGGTQADGNSFASAISRDGRYVAFSSSADNLVARDTNATQDVFVRDRVTGVTARVSVGDVGGFDPAISADGRYVAFVLPFMLEGDDRGAGGVAVRDRVTGTTTQVDVATDGTPGIILGDEDGRPVTGVGAPSISADGRYVGFSSGSSNLVAGDTNGAMDVFVRDRLAAVPATPFGDFNGNGWSDLLARQVSTGYLWLYPGNAAGLSARVRIGTGWNSMSAITRLGDFNRDGHEDVIARDRAGALWLYRGTGSRFAPRLKIGRSGWNAMREITAVGDFNRDGYPDLVAVKSSTGALYLYPGRGTSLGARRLIGAGGWNAMSELTGVGDFNGDGKPDLVARRNSTGALWLYPGTGTRLAARRNVGLRGWNGMRDLVGIGDFDRDGFTDLIAVKSATGKLLLYPGHRTSLGSPLQIGTGWTTNYRPLL